MREIRLSGSEGGVADNGHLYPYPQSSPEIGQPVARPLSHKRTWGADQTLLSPRCNGIGRAGCVFFRKGVVAR